ncbi:MAG: sulfatase, partial [Chlorobiales bacterium]|nr:sulfatase [Chlorobiales bacterium]
MPHTLLVRLYVVRDRTMRIFSALLFVQLILHLCYSLNSRDPLLLPPHLVAWLHDVLLLSLVFGLLRLCTFLLPGDKRSIGDTLAGIVLTGSGMLLSLYPQMLREYLSFPANILDGNSSSALILVREYLGFNRLFPAVFAITTVL